MMNDTPTVSSPDPLDQRPPATAYYGLLTNPPGTYGLIWYGSTTAVTLRGSVAFIERAYNLFCSFGGECLHPDGHGGFRRESRKPGLRTGVLLDTAFLCMPRARVYTALRLYLFAQLARAKGQCASVWDEEAEMSVLVGEGYTNEAELAEEAAQLATAFMAFEMEPDHAVVGGYAPVDPRPYCAEWRVHEPAGGHWDEDEGFD